MSNKIDEKMKLKDYKVNDYKTQYTIKLIEKIDYIFDSTFEDVDKAKVKYYCAKKRNNRIFVPNLSSQVSSNYK